LLEIDRDEFAQLDDCMKQVSTLAVSYEQNPTKLLHILRELEKLHRQICDELFLPALPTARHSLFNLLLEIEANGGWPYIYRIRLQQLCQNLEQNPEQNLEQNLADNQAPDQAIATNCQNPE
jgi:hypothetical protein